MLDYRTNRKDLIEGLSEFETMKGQLEYYKDKPEQKTDAPLKDICPFSVMATFNLEPARGKPDKVTAKRLKVLRELCEFLGIEDDLEFDFRGVPALPYRNPRFFEDTGERRDDDIDALWNVFTAAADFVDSQSPEDKMNFATTFDKAIMVKSTAWNLSIGLYWSNPKGFLTLDKNSCKYIKGKLSLPLPRIYLKRVRMSEGYLDLMQMLKIRFDGSDYPFDSFPELSYVARMETKPEKKK